MHQPFSTPDNPGVYPDRIDGAVTSELPVWGHPRPPRYEHSADGIRYPPSAGNLEDEGGTAARRMPGGGRL